MTEDRPQYGTPRDEEVEALIRLIQEQAQHTDTLRRELSVAVPHTLERLRGFFTACMQMRASPTPAKAEERPALPD